MTTSDHMTRLDADTPFLIRRSLVSSYGAMDVTPVGAAVVAAVLLVAATLVNRPWTWAAALFAGSTLVMLEGVNARDFVTPTAVVRERGIFRRAQQRIGLRHVAAVDVREGFALAVPRRRDVVVVSRTGERLEFLGVRDAEGVAARIEALAAVVKGQPLSGDGRA